MATGATVVVQHEPAGRVAGSLAHVDSLAAPRAGERVMACVSRERLTRFPLTDEAGTPDGIGRYNHHDQAGPGRR